MIVMPYTFEPKENHAKVYRESQRVSKRNLHQICRSIKGKTVKRSKMLLEDVIDKRRSIKGKYYSNAASEMLDILNSCEKNAENIGLDIERLFVHASVHKGRTSHRRRRFGFGTGMKTANIEFMLIERGLKKPEKSLKEKSKESSNEEKPKESDKIEKDEKVNKSVVNEKPADEKSKEEKLNGDNKERQTKTDEK